MPDKDAATPRVFLIRHGETEWTINGNHTSFTDLPLTANGEKQVTATGKLMIGHNKLIDPSRLAHVFVSPRIRAKRTLELAFGAQSKESLNAEGKITETEKITEWNFGRYEGVHPRIAFAGRKERGLDKDRPYNMWRDGCEDGEMPDQIAARLDSLIEDVRKFHSGNMKSERPGDVVIVAHGKIFRAFAKRWVNLPLDDPLELMMAPGAVACLSYYQADISQPAIQLGLSIPTDEA